MGGDCEDIQGEIATEIPGDQVSPNQLPKAEVTEVAARSLGLASPPATACPSARAWIFLGTFLFLFSAVNDLSGELKVSDSNTAQVSTHLNVGWWARPRCSTENLGSKRCFWQNSWNKAFAGRCMRHCSPNEQRNFAALVANGRCTSAKTDCLTGGKFPR